MFCLKILSTYGRKQKAAAMTACRWGNLEKVTVKDFQCHRNLKDAETQTEISIALSSPANSVSAAFLTAPKLRDVFCDKTVRLCEPVSVNFLSPLFRYNTNKRSYRGH